VNQHPNSGHQCAAKYCAPVANTDRRADLKSVRHHLATTHDLPVTRSGYALDRVRHRLLHAKLPQRVRADIVALVTGVAR
jgi:hypothetical protein